MKKQIKDQQRAAQVSSGNLSGVQPATKQGSSGGAMDFLKQIRQQQQQRNRRQTSQEGEEEKNRSVSSGGGLGGEQNFDQ